MNSETPPENITQSISPRYVSGGSRSSPFVSSVTACGLSIANSLSVMPATILRKFSCVSFCPSSTEKPAQPACLRPASSMRTTPPSLSKASRRAPMSIAETSWTLPALHKANLLVPPPISTFSTTPPIFAECATAPEPCAAMVASRPSPALTATNLPASWAKSSPMARALRRRTATPVRISAPVSTSSRRILAFLYCWLMNAPNASTSIRVSST